MGYFKKRIILKNQSSDLSKGMAVLTLEQTDAGTFGNLKLYDIQSQSDLFLGVSSNGKQVFNEEINLNKSNTYIFKVDKNININDNMCAIIVKKRQNDVEPVVWGGNSNKGQFIDDCMQFYNKTTEVQFSSVEVFDSSVKEKTEQPAQPSAEALKNAKLFENTEEEIEEVINENLDEGFYNLIKEQLDELFSKFPADDTLSNIIPDSKWVRVDYDNMGKEYVVGIIYEGDKVKYICYGVPALEGESLPEELEDFGQWLPLQSDDANGKGFYIMFQDADTGESVKLA